MITLAAFWLGAWAIIMLVGFFQALNEEEFGVAALGIVLCVINAVLGLGISGVLK